MVDEEVVVEPVKDEHYKALLRYLLYRLNEAAMRYTESMYTSKEALAHFRLLQDVLEGHGTIVGDQHYVYYLHIEINGECEVLGMSSRKGEK